MSYIVRLRSDSSQWSSNNQLEEQQEKFWSDGNFKQIDFYVLEIEFQPFSDGAQLFCKHLDLFLKRRLPLRDVK